MDSKLIPILEDENLLLRPWIIEYAEDYYRINSNPNVTDAAAVVELIRSRIFYGKLADRNV